MNKWYYCGHRFLQWVINLRAITTLLFIMRVQAPKVLFLIKTKQSVEEMRKITEDLPYQAMFVVPSLGRNGGLPMLWKGEVDLHIQTYSQNHIDAIIYSSMENYKFLWPTRCEPLTWNLGPAEASPFLIHNALDMYWGLQWDPIIGGETRQNPKTICSNEGFSQHPASL